MIKDITTAKDDGNKLQIALVPMQFVRDVAEVRMYGNEKYHSPSNWATVDKKRYVNALMRHLLAYLDDENSVDEESGIPHYKHAACNMAFICEMERKDWEERQKQIIEQDSELVKKLEEQDKEKSVIKNTKNSSFKTSLLKEKIKGGQKK